MKTIRARDLMTLQNNERIFITEVDQDEVVIQALTDVGWTNPETRSYVIVGSGDTVRVRMVS